MPETEPHALDDRGPRETQLLRELNESLHDLSQPMTVLLCTLEHGAGLESLSEMREMVVLSQAACERMRRTVMAMQSQLKQVIESDRRGGTGRPTDNH